MAGHSLKHRFEYVSLRVIEAILSWVPYPMALCLGWALAWVGHYIMGYRADAARQRIRQVFGHRFNTQEVRRIAWLAWRNFLFNVVDMVRIRKVDSKWIERHVVGYDQIRDTLQAQCQTGKGAVIASGHLGAVEMASEVMQQFDAPIFLIMGKQKNQLVDAHIDKMRQATGIPTVKKGSSMLLSVIRRLRKGEFLAFLTDLRVPQNGIMVDFLGGRASVAPGMALFAKQGKVPILPFIITREGWTRHRMAFHPCVPPDPDLGKRQDQERMTQIVFDIIDEAVRRQPEQWFWYNKNWILDPPEDLNVEHRTSNIERRMA